MARGRARRAAGPAPDALLQQVTRRLESGGWPAGLTLFTGSDRFHQEAALKAVIAALVPEDASDFALSVFGDGAAEVGDVLAAARSRPMFAPRRVVLVREGEALRGEPEPLAAFAADPPPGSYLLVRAESLDRRRKLPKTLAEAGTTLEFSWPEHPDPRRRLAVVKRLAQERGLTLAADAAAFLLEATAGDFHRVSAELDKLWASAGTSARKRVDLAAAQRVAAGAGAMSGWEIADAVQRRERGAALAATRRLLDAGSEPLQLLGGLAYRARMMLQSKAAQEGGASPRDVAAAGRVWGPRAKAWLADLARYSLDELRAFPSLLLDADRRLKSSALDPRAVIERLVASMVGSTR